MPGRSAEADRHHDLVKVGSGFQRELVTSTILSRLLADQVLIDSERAAQLVFDTKEREARISLLQLEGCVLPARDQQIRQANLTPLIGGGRRADDLVRARQRGVLDVLEFLLQ
jgi:hypothetical protein